MLPFDLAYGYVFWTQQLIIWRLDNVIELHNAFLFFKSHFCLERISNPLLGLLSHDRHAFELVRRKVIHSSHLLPHLLELFVPGSMGDKCLDLEHLTVDFPVEVQLKLLKEQIDQVVWDLLLVRFRGLLLVRLLIAVMFEQGHHLKAQVHVLEHFERLELQALLIEEHLGGVGRVVHR